MSESYICRLEINMDPVAKQLDGKTSNGNNPEDKIEFRRQASQQLTALGVPEGLFPLTQPVEVSYQFVFTDKSLPAQTKRETLGAPYSNTPDLDNLIKFAQDELIGILWADDRQVTQYTEARKLRGEAGKIIVILHRCLFDSAAFCAEVKRLRDQYAYETSHGV